MLLGSERADSCASTQVRQRSHANERRWMRRACSTLRALCLHSGARALAGLRATVLPHNPQAPCSRLIGPMRVVRERAPAVALRLCSLLPRLQEPAQALALCKLHRYCTARGSCTPHGKHRTAHASSASDRARFQRRPRAPRFVRLLPPCLQRAPLGFCMLDHCAYEVVANKYSRQRKLSGFVRSQ